MIHIIPKPTDTPDDNSTGMVMDALRKMGVPFEVLDLASVDPFNLPVSGETIWACGIKQDGVQFELLKALEMENRVINSTEAIATCASKVTTTAKMFHIGAPSPATCFTNDKAVVQRFVDEHGGRAVYKPVYGFDGNGIYLFHSADEIKEEPPYYVQEYVKKRPRFQNLRHRKQSSRRNPACLRPLNAQHPPGRNRLCSRDSQRNGRSSRGRSPCSQHRLLRS